MEEEDRGTIMEKTFGGGQGWEDADNGIDSWECGCSVKLTPDLLCSKSQKWTGNHVLTRNTIKKLKDDASFNPLSSQRVHNFERKPTSACVDHWL